MSELKLPRLLAAAKEFNIGQETLIDFLAKKGFNKDDLKPTAKLSEEMYYALQAEFQSDKAAKNKADQIEIPKSVAPDKKKKEEETVTKKVEKKAEEIKVEPSPIKEEPLEEKKPDEVKKVEVEVEKKVEQKTTATEIVAPKVVDKIDLSAIDSSTRPKKTAKAKTTEPTKEQPSSKKEETAKVEQQEPKVEPAITEETNSIVKPPDTASTIVENIEVEKLTGPKILGKITLPVDSDTRPKPISKVEQHKRKRIVVDKKPGSNIQRVDFRKEGGGQTQTGNNNRGGNQQQQNRFGGKPGGGGGHPQRGGGRNAGNNRGKQDNRRVADKEIDAKEIQDKIKETQAKLAGSGGRGKSLKIGRAHV